MGRLEDWKIADNGNRNLISTFAKNPKRLQSEREASVRRHVETMRLRSLYRFLVVLTVPMLLPTLVQAEDLSLVVMPLKISTSEFGKLTDRGFMIWNNSSNALMIKKIESSVEGNSPIVLRGSKSGTVHKDSQVDAYHYDPVAQQMAQEPFCSGLLLPGEDLTVACQHRSVAKQEDFRIEYWKGSQAYDGSAKSLEPIHVYVREGSSLRYVPFSEDRWKSVSTNCGPVNAIGAGSPRSVLIPNLHAQSLVWTTRVDFAYEGNPLCLEEAREIAVRVSGATNRNLRLVRSSFLNGYAVFDTDGTWILSSRGQKERNEMLGVLPSELLNDLDSGRQIQIRVGDKQEGFGLNEKPASWKLWDRYPVFFGDGRYTLGEFIRLDSGQILDFIRLAKAKSRLLSSCGGSAYFLDGAGRPSVRFLPAQNRESQTR